MRRLIDKVAAVLLFSLLIDVHVAKRVVATNYKAAGRKEEKLQLENSESSFSVFHFGRIE